MEEGEVAKGASREGDGPVVIGMWEPGAARQDAGQRQAWAWISAPPLTSWTSGSTSEF